MDELNLIRKKVRFAGDQMTHFKGCLETWRTLRVEKQDQEEVDQKELDVLDQYCLFAADSIDYWKYMYEAWKETEQELTVKELAESQQLKITDNEQEEV